MKTFKKHKELDEHVLVLILSVLTHTIFSLSSFLFIIFYSVGYHSSMIDVIVTFTVVSFIVFNRCVAIDIYEYLRDGREHIPSLASDDLARNILKNFLRKPKHKKKNKGSLRLDILTNVKPFVGAYKEDIILKFLSRKMHYTVINVILTVLLLVKYKKEYIIPLLIPWLSNSFHP